MAKTKKRIPTKEPTKLVRTSVLMIEVVDTWHGNLEHEIKKKNPKKSVPLTTASETLAEVLQEEVEGLFKKNKNNILNKCLRRMKG